MANLRRAKLIQVIPPEKKTIKQKKIERSVDYADKYAEYLSGMDWSYWCTFTTRYPLTLKSARRLMERFHARNLRADLNCRMFWVAEKFEVKEGYHTHALLYVDELHKDLLSWEGAFEVLRYNYQIVSGAKFSGFNDGKLVFEGYNRLQLRKFDYERSGGVGKYCCKYVMKEQKNSLLCEYDLLIS